MTERTEAWRPAPLPEGVARDPNPPFPNHHPRPVDVTVFSEIEAVAMAILALRDAMIAARPEFRWLATSMGSPELSEILNMLREDDREFTAQNIRDLGSLVTITPVPSP
jgi:hypothetical protein